MEARQEEIKEKKPKTWEEAISELQGFILKAKKEEAKQKAQAKQTDES